MSSSSIEIQRSGILSPIIIGIIGTDPVLVQGPRLQTRIIPINIRGITETAGIPEYLVGMGIGCWRPAEVHRGLGGCVVDQTSDLNGGSSIRRTRIIICKNF